MENDWSVPLFTLQKHSHVGILILKQLLLLKTDQLAQMLSLHLKYRGMAESV